MSKPFVVTREHGEDLGATIGATLFQRPEQIVLETGANSWDADASYFKVSLHQDDGYIILEDDGFGMDEDGIRSFFRMGDSTKKASKKSPKGRDRIGKYGIAAIGVRSFWGKHRLDSWRDGLHYVIEEEFAAGDKDSTEIPCDPTPCDEDKHGVRITLSDMRVSKGSRIKEKDLIRILREELPSSVDGFDVYVNDTLVQPQELRGALEYVIDIPDDPLLGRVYGNLFLSKRSLGLNSGIFTKVHGRAVGGRNLDLISNTSLKSTLYGVVHADSLDDSITFDRLQFTASRKVDRLKQIITGVVQQARRDADLRAKQTKIAQCSDVLSAHLLSVGKMIGNHMDGGPPYDIVFDAREAGDVLYVDDVSRRVFVNPEARPFDLTLYKRRDVQASLGRIGMLAVALSKLNPVEQENAEAAILTFSELEKGRSKNRRMLAHIVPKDDEGGGRVAARAGINENRLYTQKDAAAVTFPAWMLKRFQASGLVAPHREDLYLGSDLLDLMENFEGRVTIYEAARHVPVPKGYSEAYAFRQRRITNGEKNFATLVERGELPDYVHNVADKDQTPIYTVPRERLGDLVHFLHHEKFVDELPDEYAEKFGKRSRRREGELSAVAVLDYDLEEGLEGEKAVLEMVRAYSDQFAQRYLQGLIRRGVFTNKGVRYNGVETGVDDSVPLKSVADHLSVSETDLRARMKSFSRRHTKDIPTVMTHGLDTRFCYGNKEDTVPFDDAWGRLHLRDADMELVEYLHASGVLDEDYEKPNIERGHLTTLYDRLLSRACDQITDPKGRSELLKTLGYLPLTTAVATLVESGLAQNDAFKRVSESTSVVLGYVKIGTFQFLSDF